MKRKPDFSDAEKLLHRAGKCGDDCGLCKWEAMEEDAADARAEWRREREE